MTPPTSLPDLLAPIKKRLSAATPGKWLGGEMTITKENWGGLWDKLFHMVRRGRDVVAVVWDPDEVDGEQKANAELIANSPTDISRLIRALECACEALEDIAKPTYGTEFCNTDEENNEILARHHFSGQAKARQARAQVLEMMKGQE